RGVRSIEIDDGSVFHTREAEQLERLLWSVADPGRGTRVRGALAGDLFGLDTRVLLALGEDESAWSAWAGRLADWRAHWESRGIGSVLLRLLEGEGGAQHLLGHPDGARRLTNYRHLAEILQACETRERLAPAELAAWLNRRRGESGSRDDDEKLRIESDEQLVKILTVHGSKGLEFPVVFCPFAWDAPSPKRRAGAVDTVYHLGAEENYREVIDLDPDERAVAIERLEEFAESVRLLYVALTRAKYRCVVAWGQVRGAEHSPLAWLLHRPANGVDGAGDPDTAVAALRAVAERFVDLDAREWRAEVDAFAQRVPDAVSVSELEPVPPSIHAAALTDSAPAVAVAREPCRALRRIRSLTSFSALSAQAAPVAGAAGGAQAGRDEMDIDRPDHDQHQEPRDAAVEETGTAGAPAGGRTAFTFPRGPVAGSCLHRIFERLDFPLAMEQERPEQPDLDEICREALDDFGIDHAWRQTARAMVERTRSVLLHERGPGRPDGASGVGANEAANPHVTAAAGGAVGAVGEAGAAAFRLADPHRRLVELEFHFPVDGLDRERLGARMVEHGYPNPFAGAWRTGASEPSPPIHGFLRGFIDLVVEHAGRWYVLDYKSNWLGPWPDDYAPEALDAAMRAGGYTLQYLVYLVALHRYLAVRLPDYEYARHVGGAFYLFVRGIDPATGLRRGVHFDRPSAECLLAIDDCFRGGGA
ncbi:MAG: PD-(D/E)XK nuclease family protein, partial [Acidobacteriota bacterium]|nr:PD-(D/E)XK nuclease family protein [Acidobacteriota bacterium]